MYCKVRTVMLLVVLFCVHGDYAARTDFEDLNQLLSVIYKPRVPARYAGGSKLGVPTVTSFSWQSCGSSSDLAILTKLTVSPDPIPIPGNVTISASGKVSKDLTSPIKVELELKKHIFVWVTIPCVDNIGSCSYEDVCTLAQLFPCPPEFQKYGIPCHCPIKANSYNVPTASIFVDPKGIPEWATDGDYKINVKASHNGEQILCLDLDVSLRKA